MRKGCCPRYCFVTGMYLPGTMVVCRCREGMGIEVLEGTWEIEAGGV